jgi:hypothetical protein
MNIFIRPAALLRSRMGDRALVSLLSLALFLTAWPQSLAAQQDAASAATAPDAPAPAQDAQAPAQPPQRAQYTQQTPEQMQQLVAPIALYPDSLVAQILAASTFPEQVVEADRWVQAHPDLKGEDLGKAVDQQPWDPSVKALTAFPSVLGNMDKNLSWTSSLGDAYYNQQQDVMDAVQVMRRKAQDSGNLKTTPQQKVVDQDSAIDIEPVDPEVVYVPAYDPWLVYGDPILAWPGWYPYPGIWFGGPYLSFGFGFGIGWFGGFGWGWGHWGFDWHNHYAVYDHNRYYSHSATFYNRNNYYRGGERGGAEHGGADRGGFNEGHGASEAGRGGFNGGRGGADNHPGASPRPFNGDSQAARGYGESRGQSGVRSGAFSGYNNGGTERSYSSRGSASFGGGGGFHGGGGGGGSHGGGGGRR